MAELFLSAVLSALLEKLTSPELLNFATEKRVSPKLENLVEMVETIDALLFDVAENQMTDEFLKIWLERVEDWAYDAEDMLDEYATEALSKQSIPAGRGNPSSLNVYFNADKIDSVTERFEQLYEMRYKFGLLEFHRETSALSWQRPLATCYPSESVIYGRDEDKAKILEMLLRDEPNGGVISIVGMAGVGKTTLAQLVYDREAWEYFELEAWVCVSNDFDVLRISKTVLEDFTGRTWDLQDLNSIQAQLRHEVKGRKFLLVLDDVWNDNFSMWDGLRQPLVAGARGSRIIVTTRLERVALTMTSSSEYCHRLGLLSDDDCWSLFKNHAFDRIVMDADSSELIRQKVVEKCKGLPLVAKTFGDLLRRVSREQWFDILNINLWELKEGKEILADFQVSYYHLPPHLKRCFAYCAIFPKGYEFEEKEVLLLWMAQDLIQQSTGNTQLEDLGGAYFHDLVSRSVFLKSSRNNSRYVMHDLVNDFAQMVFHRISFRFQYQNSKPLRSSTSIRHVSSICFPYNVRSNFEVLSDVTPLRTYLSLLPVNNWFKSYDISQMFVFDLLLKFEKLRALSVQNYNIIELPNSIENMRLLRYLNLSGSEIKSLPESVNSLYNLQTLILRNCQKLSMLPHSMGSLINLRHFDIFGASSINKIPLGINHWECLRTLSNFIVGEDSCSSLKDLKDLKFLCGELHISKLENVIDFENKPEIILSNKRDLRVLLLEWGSMLDGSRAERVEEKVLDMLQPHQNLEELTIKSYCGKQISSWLGGLTFSMSSGITILKLEDCIRCTSLPSLGLLGSLKNLTIKGMIRIKSVGLEFYGKSCSEPFPSLETLSFEGLEEWEEWKHVEADVESFPQLRELSIVRCTKLSGTLPNHLLLLEKLVIRSCKELVVSFSTFPTLCKLEIDECKRIVCDSPIGSNSLNSMLLSNVLDVGNEVLNIKGCEELWLKKNLPEGIITNNAGLQKLRIEDCHSLTSIVRGQLPASLKRLDIRNCTNLQNLLEDNGNTSSFSSSSAITNFPQTVPSPENVNTSILIEGCHFLTSIVRWLIASLKRLDIRNYINLQHLSEDNGETSSGLQNVPLLQNVNTSIPHLEDLYIQECSSLIRLPSIDQFSASLTHLRIKKCSKLTTLSSRSLSPTVLKYLEIEDCLELTTLLPRGGQLPETLENLKISWCPKLKSIAERFHNNTTLCEIWIEGCEELKSIPKGLHTLTSLRDIGISYCPSLVSFPEFGFPNTKLRVWIKTCEKLKALPSQIHTLTSLQLLSLCDCASMSFPAEGLPTKLKSLAIQGHNLYKALRKEDLPKLTSLKELSICGLPDILPDILPEIFSFQEQEIEITLPSTLTRLYIGNFPNLKDLSSMNLQNLTNLEWLCIDNCPNLKSLPSLPPSLLELYTNKCPLLRNKGYSGPR